MMECGPRVDDKVIEALEPACNQVGQIVDSLSKALVRKLLRVKGCSSSQSTSAQTSQNADNQISAKCQEVSHMWERS